MRPHIAEDGWVSVQLDDGVTTVHVRVGGLKVEDLGGGFHSHHPIITGLLVEGREVTTETLRQIRPVRVLAAIDPSEWAAPPPEADDETTLGDLRSRAAGAVRGRKRVPVGRPDGTDPATFYRRVAAAYRSAATDSNKPAVLLAEENEVPVETVRRWVKEARRRGALGPGRKGRAG